MVNPDIGSHGAFRKVVLGSAAWSVARTTIDQIFRFVIFVLLARILSPEDFGLFALTTLFTELARIFATTGWGDVLIRAEGRSRELTNTVFWSTLGITFIVVAAIVASSPLLAYFLDQPKLALLLGVLAPSLLVSPFVIVCTAAATKEFKHKQLTYIGTASSALGGVAALYVASRGWGLWSFVIQTYVTGVSSALMIWCRFPFRVSFEFNVKAFKSAFTFSSALIVGVAAQTLVVRAQDVIIGKFLGSTAVGQYRISVRVYEIINASLTMPLASVAMPALSRMRDEQLRFEHAYLRMIGMAAAIACPAAAGFAAVAEYAVPALFGAQWNATIPVIQVLSLLAPANVIAFFTVPALTAVGRVKTILFITLLQLVGTVIFSIAAAPHGLFALAAAWVLRSYLTLPIQMCLFRRSTGIRFWKVILELLPPVLSSFGMAMIVYAMLNRTDVLPGDLWGRLSAGLALGVVAYVLIMVSMFRKFVFHHASALSSLRAGP